MATNTSPTNGSSTTSAPQVSAPASGASTKAKRKAPAKAKAAPVAAARAKAPAAPAVSASQPVEILFTQEPNPYHPAKPPFLWIDHPQQNERLLASTYVIRLGAGGADGVQLSVDKGPWQNCRQTSGYWWFDWSAIAPGKHTLVARMRASDGRWFRTPVRNCDHRP